VIASGPNSTAIGKQSISAGWVSLSTGRNTSANGNASATFGLGTTTSADNAFATGQGTIASGINSFAGGNQSKATGNNSVAFGDNSISSNSNSFSIGHKTSATGWESVAFGDSSISSGGISFASGYHSAASGWTSFSAGNAAMATGDVSFAIGSLTRAAGSTSIATGFGTLANGYNALSGGDHSKALGNNSLAFGLNTTAIGSSSIAFGASTKAKAFASLVIGQFNDTSGIGIQKDWFSGTDQAFVIGNGWDETTRSNAFTVLQNGKTAIGIVTPTEMLDVNGNARFRSVKSGGGVSALYIDINGVLTTSTSDESLKHNFVHITAALEKVKAMNGLYYSWKNDLQNNRRIGFIAQEMEKIVPEAVFTNPTDGLKGINYAELTAVLAEAIKEQQVQINSLSEENKTLKAKADKIDAMQAQIDELKNLINKKSGK
jgi:hypothetical protein